MRIDEYILNDSIFVMSEKTRRKHSRHTQKSKFMPYKKTEKYNTGDVIKITVEKNFLITKAATEETTIREECAVIVSVKTDQLQLRQYKNDEISKYTYWAFISDIENGIPVFVY